MIVWLGNSCRTSFTNSTKCSEYPFATSTQMYDSWGTAWRMPFSFSRSPFARPTLAATCCEMGNNNVGTKYWCNLMYKHNNTNIRRDLVVNVPHNILNAKGNIQTSYLRLSSPYFLQRISANLQLYNVCVHKWIHCAANRKGKTTIVLPVPPKNDRSNIRFKKKGVPEEGETRKPVRTAIFSTVFPLQQPFNEPSTK